MTYPNNIIGWTNSNQFLWEIEISTGGVNQNIMCLGTGTQPKIDIFRNDAQIIEFETEY